MQDLMQIGGVRFEFRLPSSYPWKEKDKRFKATTHQEYNKKVKVNVHFTHSLEEPEERPLYDAEGLKVWQSGNTHLRSYRALFLPGHPLYAVSRWEGDEVEILFDDVQGAWNHPNMMLWTLVHMESQLLQDRSFLLHSCYTAFEGKAILFSAPSGTGKTTQANIWKRVYGSEIINGDLSLIRHTDWGWMACGYPVSGSAEECFNESYPIRGIAIVRQAPENHLEELTLAQKIQWLYSESFINQWDRHQVTLLLDLLTHLAQNVPVVMLHCNMEDEAAQVLQAYLKK